MNCWDIHEHLRWLGPWVNWERTTDTFKAGDPDKTVRKVAVAWKPTWDALKRRTAGGRTSLWGTSRSASTRSTARPSPRSSLR